MRLTTKRTLLAVGLGLALTGGAATAAHASTHVTTRPAAVTADLVVGATGAQTAEAPDAGETASSAADPAGGANDQSGAQDTTGVDTAEAPGAGEGAPSAADAAGGPNDQSGDQSGQ